MSNITHKAVTLTAVLICATSFNTISVYQKIYDINYATIKYLLSSSLPSTTDTVIRVFKDYGNQEKIEVISNLKWKSRIIFLDSIRYMMVDTLQAIKSSRKKGFSLQNLDFSFLENNGDFGDYKIVSKQRALYLSKTCVKYSFINTRLNIEGMVWIWQKVPLKAEIRIGKHTQKFNAISIDTLSLIKDSAFVLPSNIEIIEPEM